ncbi:hypothetical protein OROMI_017236 [Orobanche minor]
MAGETKAVDHYSADRGGDWDQSSFGCVFALLFPHGFFSSNQPTQICPVSNSDIQESVMVQFGVFSLETAMYNASWLIERFFFNESSSSVISHIGFQSEALNSQSSVLKPYLHQILWYPRGGSCSLCFPVLYREDSPFTKVEPYVLFNINPTRIQPVLTTSYLLAFPSISYWLTPLGTLERYLES